MFWVGEAWVAAAANVPLGVEWLEATSLQFLGRGPTDYCEIGPSSRASSVAASVPHMWLAS